MKNQDQLRDLLKVAGFKLKPDTDLKQLLRRRATALYRDYPPFHEFLTAQTSFLPKDIDPLTRWYYYIDGMSEAKTCSVCGKIPDKYSQVMCSAECSRIASIGRPHVVEIDHQAREHKYREWLAADQPDYQMVVYGPEVSTFRHICGNTFESDPYALIDNRIKCPCLHKKVVRLSLEHLVKRYAENNSNWKPLQYEEGSDKITCRNSVCGHKAVLRVATGMGVRCPTCFPDPYSVNVKTTAQYREELREFRPDLELLGEWESASTLTEYRHLECGKTFHAYPSLVKRKQFYCPNCNRGVSSYQEFWVGDRLLRVRGKERVALRYLTENTDWVLDDIEVDSDGRIPFMRYRDPVAGRLRKYRPDFYVPHLNLLIEVKDLNTIGLHHKFFGLTSDQLWAVNQAKAKACLTAGYKFKMLLFNHVNEVVKLPKEWYNYSHARMCDHLRRKGKLP